MSVTSVTVTGASTHRSQAPISHMHQPPKFGNSG